MRDLHLRRYIAASAALNLPFWRTNLPFLKTVHNLTTLFLDNHIDPSPKNSRLCIAAWSTGRLWAISWSANVVLSTYCSCPIHQTDAFSCDHRFTCTTSVAPANDAIGMHINPIVRSLFSAPHPMVINNKWPQAVNAAQRAGIVCSPRSPIPTNGCPCPRSHSARVWHARHGRTTGSRGTPLACHRPANSKTRDHQSNRHAQHLQVFVKVT